MLQDGTAGDGRVGDKARGEVGEILHKLRCARARTRAGHSCEIDRGLKGMAGAQERPLRSLSGAHARRTARRPSRRPAGTASRCRLRAPLADTLPQRLAAARSFTIHKKRVRPAPLQGVGLVLTLCVVPPPPTSPECRSSKCVSGPSLVFPSSQSVSVAYYLRGVLLSDPRRRRLSECAARAACPSRAVLPPCGTLADLVAHVPQGPAGGAW